MTDATTRRGFLKAAFGAGAAVLGVGAILSHALAEAEAEAHLQAWQVDLESLGQHSKFIQRPRCHGRPFSLADIARIFNVPIDLLEAMAA